MRVYTVSLDGVSVSAAKSLIRLSAPSSMVLVILRAWLEQQAVETSEQLEVLLQRASTNGTGSASVPEKHEVGDPVATATAVDNLTVEPTLTAKPLVRDSFNVLNGWVYVPVPEERIWIPPSGRLVLKLNNAPAAALTMTAGITFGEVG